MTTGAKNLFIVFVKYPAPGKVKRRLAAATGARAACRAYREIAVGVVRRCAPARDSNYRLSICFTPSRHRNRIRQWLCVPAGYALQPLGDIGRRMSRAFQRAFGQGFKKVVLAGSDCPGLDRTAVSSAFHLLQRSDVVLGPALDGGYYLIGLNAHQPELFQGIDWSTEKVFEQTAAQVAAQGLSLATLATLRDIDRGSDLAWYLKTLPLPRNSGIRRLPANGACARPFTKNIPASNGQSA